MDKNERLSIVSCIIGLRTRPENKTINTTAKLRNKYPRLLSPDKQEMNSANVIEVMQLKIKVRRRANYFRFEKILELDTS